MKPTDYATGVQAGLSTETVKWIDERLCGASDIQYLLATPEDLTSLTRIIDGFRTGTRHHIYQVTVSPWTATVVYALFKQANRKLARARLNKRVKQLEQGRWIEDNDMPISISSEGITNGNTRLNAVIATGKTVKFGAPADSYKVIDERNATETYQILGFVTQGRDIHAAVNRYNTLIGHAPYKSQSMSPEETFVYFYDDNRSAWNEVIDVARTAVRSSKIKLSESTVAGFLYRCKELDWSVYEAIKNAMQTPHADNRTARLVTAMNEAAFDIIVDVAKNRSSFVNARAAKTPPSEMEFGLLTFLWKHVAQPNGKATASQKKHLFLDPLREDSASWPKMV